MVSAVLLRRLAIMASMADTEGLKEGTGSEAVVLS